MCGGQWTICRRVVHTLLSSNGFQGLKFGPRACLKPSHLLSYLIDPILFTLKTQLLTNLIRHMGLHCTSHWTALTGEPSLAIMQLSRTQWWKTQLKSKKIKNIQTLSLRNILQTFSGINKNETQKILESSSNIISSFYGILLHRTTFRARKVYKLQPSSQI